MLLHHKYSPVAVSVNAPQFHVGLGSDCSRPRGAVDQGQLSEAASFPNTGHPFIVHVHLSDRTARPNIVLQKWQKKKKVIALYKNSWWAHTHIHLPLVDNIEIVAFVTWE